ncbi:MAG: helix-turn-helix domain-containing protein [Ignavibacteriales bacterium]|jgi:Zn-dependent peptidase ImmA (M78 family)/DNA-binding XRE family transcriptional regulator|nr:helix-turn-helix domain-containing protein [Ignavibacteriales bacterium]
MLGQRIKQFRLAKNYSLDELVAATGGIVSKVALSKYERELIKPSNKVLTAIAKALNVKTINLALQPNVKVQFIAYRKGSGLSKKEQSNVESLITSKLEDRVKIQDLLFSSSKPNLPVKSFKVKSIKDVESFAIELRSKWKLGLDPISNLTELLENNFVHVIFIDNAKSFDGISALVYANDTQLKAAAVVSKNHIPGERQRLNLAHELGHIVLDIAPNLDEERVAFRFGGAFLAPKDSVLNIVGSRREHFQPRELFILKKIFGISIQALLFRLRDLDIISQTSFSNWYRLINKNNWKKNEPMPMEEETSHWFEKNVLHAFSEGLISSDEAARLLGENIDSQELSLIKKKEFLKLSQTDRSKILSEQAEKFIEYYTTNNEWKEFGGDIVEY